MKNALKVENASLVRRNDRVTLSADVAGQHLFWEMPDRPEVALRGEPFIAGLLVTAMTTGQDLHLPAGVPTDPAFLRSTATLQTIFARWFTGLRVIAVHAEPAATPRHTSGRFAGYSGGVDSSYTVLQLGTEIDGAVLVDGIEYGKPHNDLMAAVEQRLGAEMQARGLPLLRVATNAKSVNRALGGYWPQFIGGVLASVPHAFGASAYAIAGSNSWENLRPYGTHPYTDPLWSSATVRIEHHGTEARRIDKLQALAAAPALLNALRVCFQGTGYNCGKCHKCLQSSAALRALGVVADAMPRLANPALLRGLAVEHDGDLVDWLEILTPELRRSDPALAAELRRLIRRYQWRQTARLVDEMATGGRIRNLARRLRTGRAK